jgi:outer membrane receptor protein involved in Fe transport
VLRGLYPTGTRGTELSLKLNHQAGQKHTFSGRYAFSRGRVRAEVQGPDNFADRSSQGSSLTADHSLVGNWLRVASATTVNDLRLQFAERGMELTPNAGGPMLDIPGVATLGQFYRMDADRTERHYQIIENLNFVVRRHRLSAGVDVHAVTLDATLRNHYAGIYIFPTLESFTQGRPDVFLQAFGDPYTSPRTLPIGIWVQDRWEVLPGLSLELGIRYDRQLMPARLSSSSNNISPRAGVAWRPFDNRPLVFSRGIRPLL